jgi:hypothetical protein
MKEHFAHAAVREIERYDHGSGLPAPEKAVAATGAFLPSG